MRSDHSWVRNRPAIWQAKKKRRCGAFKLGFMVTINLL
jgi:hypothetical protein